MVCKNILFSILTRNVFPAPFLLTSGNTVLVIGITLSTNVIGDIIDKNATIFLIYFVKPGILTDDLELTCRIFLFSFYPQMLLRLGTYFEQNVSIYIQENQQC